MTVRVHIPPSYDLRIWCGRNGEHGASDINRLVSTERETVIRWDIGKEQPICRIRGQIHPDYWIRSWEMDSGMPDGDFCPVVQVDNLYPDRPTGFWLGFLRWLSD